MKEAKSQISISCSQFHRKFNWLLSQIFFLPAVLDKNIIPVAKMLLINFFFAWISINHHNKLYSSVGFFSS